MRYSFVVMILSILLLSAVVAAGMFWSVGHDRNYIPIAVLVPIILVSAGYFVSKNKKSIGDGMIITAFCGFYLATAGSKIAVAIDPDCGIPTEGFVIGLWALTAIFAAVFASLFGLIGGLIFKFSAPKPKVEERTTLH